MKNLFCLSWLNLLKNPLTNAKLSAAACASPYLSSPLVATENPTPTGCSTKTMLASLFHAYSLWARSPLACGRNGPCLAVGETVILLHPRSTFSRCFNRDGERASAKSKSRRRLALLGHEASEARAARPAVGPSAGEVSVAEREQDDSVVLDARWIMLTQWQNG